MSTIDQPVSESLCESAGLSAKARRCWERGCTGADYFERLREHGLDEDALRLVPHLLPRRETVWWGCLCAWDLGREVAAETERNAIRAVCRWVNEPSEANRQAVQIFANAGGLKTSASCLAAAVSWTDVEAGTRLVAAAVLLAAVQHEPLAYADHCRRFLAIARQVIEGRHRWDEEARSRRTAGLVPVE